MAENDLSGMKVAIVLTNDFEPVEMTEPRKALKMPAPRRRSPPAGLERNWPTSHPAIQ